MNNNQDQSTSVHFFNGDQLRCEFMQQRNGPQSDESNQENSNHESNNEDSDDQIKQTSEQQSNDTQSISRETFITKQPIHHDELESSAFCTINSNERVETTDDQPASINNFNAEIIAKYSEGNLFPRTYSEFKAPPKRSEISSFIHSPFSKTLDTFSKLSNLLKEDPEDRDDFFLRNYANNQPQRNVHPNSTNVAYPALPPPALPKIDVKNPKSRQQPVTEHEYDTELKYKSKLFVFERIFLGGLQSDSLRQRLWPVLLGIMDNDNEENWIPLTDLYNLYMKQWTSITADQESRFTAFKEKRSMAERDVVRCDRCHPYFQKQENIDILRDILMCYIMYDFDTGYVQGMTDLAAPLLYVFEGDPVKTFWCFTGVLNLTKKNFEMEQTTVKNLLIKLFKLINLTDPCFAEFLAENDSDNCYFAFRWLICLFKREFVKADNSYDQLLLLWDALWSVHAYEKVRQDEAQEEFNRQLKILKEGKSTNNVNNETTSDLTSSFSNRLELDTTLGTSPPYIIQGFENRGDFDDSNVTNNNPTADRTNDGESDEMNQLTNFELFFLSISLAIIRQERDLIFSQKLDASSILKHFNTLNLRNYLNDTLRHATLIWYWLKYEGEDQLCNENAGSKDEEKCSGGYDLLNDF